MTRRLVTRLRFHRAAFSQLYFHRAAFSQLVAAALSNLGLGARSATPGCWPAQLSADCSPQQPA